MVLCTSGIKSGLFTKSVLFWYFHDIVHVLQSHLHVVLLGCFCFSLFFSFFFVELQVIMAFQIMAPSSLMSNPMVTS